MRDIRQSLNYANYLTSQGWAVERINDTNYFIKKLPLVGSILKVQRPEKVDFDVIDKLCRKYRVFQIIIEPISIINGYQLSTSPYLPSKTIQIDLNQSIEKIYANFTKKCKYSIRRGEGLKIKEYSTPAEIIKWQKAWKESVNLNRYVPSAKSLLNLKKSFPCLRRQAQNKSLLLASHNISGSIIGGALFTISSHETSNYITYYWCGFTNKEGRTSLSQYSLLYQGILWAKRMGCKVFDFEGIYDPRFPNNSWLGFTQFKKSFGGYEVSYPGCYVKMRLPI